MLKGAPKIGGKTKSSAEVRLNEFVTKLDEFFKNNNDSPQLLNTLFEHHYPSPYIHESIIHIYSNTLTRSRLSKLLDQTIEYLHLNDDENLLKNPYHLKQIEFNEQNNNSNLLHNAIMRNFENICRLLLKSGFNPNSVLSDQKTPLSIIVVTNSIDPKKRLEYIQLLIQHGANPLLRDVKNASPFNRLCGMESNYPIVYEFFRDYLLSVYPDQAEFEFNDGLENAVFNWCVPIVADLLENGAILKPLETVKTFEHFLSQIARSIFQERRSISHIDPLILCFIQVMLHHPPCENYSLCTQKFIQLIYIPSVCFEANDDPCSRPSMSFVKKFLYLSCHYGYLTKTIMNQIRTRDLPKILTILLPNALAIQAQRQQLLHTLNQYFDELTVKYHRSPVTLKILAIRKIRQSLIKVNQKTLEQLKISRHLQTLLLSP